MQTGQAPQVIKYPIPETLQPAKCGEDSHCRLLKETSIPITITRQFPDRISLRKPLTSSREECGGMLVPKQVRVI